MSESGSTSMVRVALGAALGAAVGAAVWFVVEHIFHYRVGAIAALSGALAGWGAVWIGRTRGPTPASIAAIAGAIGILAGSYAAYRADLASEQTKQSARASWDRQNPQLAQVPATERDRVFEQAYTQFLEQTSYRDYMAADRTELLFTVVFGAIGLVYGYTTALGKRAATT